MMTWSLVLLTAACLCALSAFAVGGDGVLGRRLLWGALVCFAGFLVAFVRERRRGRRGI